MTTYYYTIFVIFAVLVYMIVVDPNVGKFIELVGQMVVVNIKRLYYLAAYHPNNKIAAWMMERRINKMASQLQKELQNDTSRSTD